MNLFQNVKDVIASDEIFTSRFVYTLLVIVCFAGVSWVISAIALRNIHDVRVRYQWKKIIHYSLAFIGFLVVGRIWFEGFKSVSTVIGLISAGLTIALKDLIVDLAGWLFIIFRRPFEVGDRIQIGSSSGDVIDLRIFKFTLLEIGNWVDADQSTGRILHVPNGKIFTEVLANYTKGFQYIWNEIPILVTFESNWKDAKKIFQKIASDHSEHLSQTAQEKVKEMSRRYMIFYSKLTPVVYTSVKDSGILLTIRYLTEPRKRRSSTEAIWEIVLEEFAKRNDMDFAYPTQRFYNNVQEGKNSTPQN